MQAAQRSAAAALPTASTPGITSLTTKDPRLPAGFYTARSTLRDTKLKSEWVDIPMEGTDVRLHTFVVYPAGTARTGVVIVMQHGVGLDDWQRALAVQVAEDGFIAVAPDLWSGTGPNGGNWDASPFIDDAMRAAAGKITPAETMRRYSIARAWSVKLPRANGKSGSIGFCAGGGNSFRFASAVPEHNASVVFYGTPPSEEEMARINAPVLAFYGENDARVTATVEPARAAMTRLGKQYEPYVYPKVTHSFVLFQDMGNNAAAVADAWPRTIAFFQRYLR
jgi:carboxymethylenebutenolidase